MTFSTDEEVDACQNNRPHVIDGKQVTGFGENTFQSHRIFVTPTHVQDFSIQGSASLTFGLKTSFLMASWHHFKVTNGR